MGDFAKEHSPTAHRHRHPEKDFLMPYSLSFEVNSRYEIHLATVIDAIERYDETYRLIGG
jgi:hypothetical protein